MAKKKPKVQDDAIAYIFNHGLHKTISEACGISRQAVQQWREVPWNRVLEVEKITGIPRHRIRPDVYPKQRSGT